MRSQTRVEQADLADKSSLAPPPGLWKIVSVAILGAFLALLNTTVVSVSLSSLAAEFGSTLAQIQWATSAYLLAIAMVLPLTGWLVQRLGIRRLYILCFAAFLLTSLLCGFAESTGALVLLRILQGLSAGMLAPLAQLTMASAAGEQLARVSGYSAATIVLAPLLGPLVASAVLAQASWHWLFWMNVPIALLAILMAWRFLPAEATSGPQVPALDWRGLALIAPGIALALSGLERLDTPTGTLMLGGALALLAGFVWHSRRAESSLLDLALFAHPVFRAAAWTQFLLNGAIIATQVLIPLYFVHATGRPPADVGWMLAPLGVGMMVAFACMGPLTERMGYRSVATGGALLASIGAGLFILLAGGSTPLALPMLALLLVGAGQGAIGIPSTTAAYTALEKAQLPMATTTLNVIQRLGGPVMATVCTQLLAWRLAAEPQGAGPYLHVLWALVLLHALCTVAAWRLPANLPPRIATQ